MVKPIDQLAGKDLAYFKVIAENLSASEREFFLAQATDILNRNVKGTADVVDSGEEAIGMARLLLDFPRINFSSITARDIQDYISLQSPVAGLLEPHETPVPVPSVEQEVDQITRQIQADPSHREIIFQGKKYNVGADTNLNPLINDALEASGSHKRIFLAGTGDGKVALLYATPLSEEKVTISGRVIRLLIVDRANVMTSISNGMTAITDQLSQIVVIRSHITGIIAIRHDNPRISSTYRQKEHAKIYDVVLKDRKHDENLERKLEVLILKHEEGHFRLREKAGHEYRFLEMELEKQGDPSLHVFDELYADMASVGHILDMAEKDPTQARDLLFAWLVFRGPKIEGDPLSVAEECVSDLLLSAVLVNEKGLTVDWTALKKRTESLKSLLDTIFSEITHNIRWDAATAVLKIRITEADAGKKYEEIRNVLVSQITTDYPEMTPSLAEMSAVAKLVSFAISQKNAGQVIMSYEGDILSYKRKIDDWMRQNLGLDNSSVPFQAPEVLIIKPEDLPEVLDQGAE